MAILDCTCKGINPNCEKCFGRGYYDDTLIVKSFIKFPEIQKKSTSPKIEISITERIQNLSKNEIEKFAGDIINLIELKSSKQMQLLNAISFRTKTFRKDFKNKFEGLKLLEIDKDFLRRDLDLLIKSSENKNVKILKKFHHHLSDKFIDVNSNKMLKQLRREYKKIKKNI